MFSAPQEFLLGSMPHPPRCGKYVLMLMRVGATCSAARSQGLSVTLVRATSKFGCFDLT